MRGNQKAELGPLKAHPHCESNEESPESQWLFGAGLGARSPQRTPRGKHGKANVLAQKRTHTAPPTSFPRRLRVLSVSSVLRRDRHKETHKPEVNQPSPITARRLENARPAITTHGGTGTQHSASRPVWRYAANSRRDRTRAFQVFVVLERSSPRETHPRRESNEESPESQWLFGAGLGAAGRARFHLTRPDSNDKANRSDRAATRLAKP